MKRLILMALVTVLIGYGWGFAADVSQGKCIFYDPSQNTLVIEEYDTNFGPDHPYGRPTGVKNTYKIDKAKVGITPQVGDILRIAYTIKGTERQALKVMNVSKQDLRKK